MKLKEVLDRSIQFFKEKKIESPRLSAELLIAEALKLERMQLYLKYETPLSEKELTVCREYIKRHSQGEPVAYITGSKGFFGEVFKVGPGVLIPRPETEGLVEEALAWVKNKNFNALQILDLGAGSGCIGFSILINLLKLKDKNFEEIHLVSVEKSARAFEYLSKNLKELKLDQYVQLIHQDVLEFFKNNNDSFDIIVANPPYIDWADSRVDKHVKEYEPHEALFAKELGMESLKSWSKACFNKVKQPGIFLLEMGFDQGTEMAVFFDVESNFSKVNIIKDLSGLDRIIKAVT